MEAVSPVMPNSEAIEVVIGKNQPQYIPLPAVYLDTPATPIISRWRLTSQERDAIAFGADVVMTQLTFGNAFQPVNLQVVMPDQMPVLVED